MIINTLAPTYAMAIGANGHVSLGGNSDGNPYDRLEVAGNARVSGYIQLSASKDHTSELVLNGSIFRNPDGELYYKNQSGVVSKLTNFIPPSYASTAAAAADGALLQGSFFKVTNGNGTSQLHIKD
jgi:hypothetical protein